jgi:hypothetical protein
MATTAAAATIAAQPGWWCKRTVSGNVQWLPVAAWSIPTTGAAEPIVLDQTGTHTALTLSGNLSEAISSIVYTGPSPSL